MTFCPKPIPPLDILPLCHFTWSFCPQVFVVMSKKHVIEALEGFSKFFAKEGNKVQNIVFVIVFFGVQKL